MPMDILTVLQTAETFAAYLLVAAWLPSVVFHRQLRGHRMTEKFVISYMIGNFYIINLVYLLQLLKISYPITLALGTFVPAVLGALKLNQVPLGQIVSRRLADLKKVTEGSMGRRTARLRIRRACGRRLRAAGRFVGGLLLHRSVDCLLTLGLLGLLFWLHGKNLVEVYGYKASDMPVHNYWINAMGENHVFVAGVYPHGFHCVIYYLHALFGFATYNILRVFGFIQAVMVHLMLLCFLKLCCRSRYAAYAGTFLYAGSTYLAGATYSRFYSALPQEFGMLFILPTAYFGFAYFETRRRELAEEAGDRPSKRGRRKKRRGRDPAGESQTADGAVPTETAPPLPAETAEIAGEALSAGPAVPEEPADPIQPPSDPPDEGRRKRREKRGRKKKGAHRKWRWLKSHLYLASFAMSFSMTLAVHFYGTMVAGLFCVAIAVGYGFLFFRKKYFWNVVATCALSVFIAVLPMAAAFLGGTPLQGSLGWGLNVIRPPLQRAAHPPGAAGAAPTPAPCDTPGTGPTHAGSEGEGPTQAQPQPDPTPAPAPDPAPEPEPAQTIPQRLREGLEKVLDRLLAFWKTLQSGTRRALLASVLRVPDNKYADYVIYGFAGLIGLGALLFLLRQRCYGAMLISSGVYLFLMGMMMCARSFGLPALMDSNRGSIYFAYSLPIVVSLLADGALELLFLPTRHKFLMHTLSLAFVCLVVWHTWETGHLREPRDTGALEMNEAITCVENIIASEKDFTWTIVSANDELRMTTDYGYHYETSTFLEDMERPEDWSSIRIRIPTPVVYIFIEKIPLDYTRPYEGSGQSVSEEGAARPMPASSGIRMYQGEERWILMSRMYYWAQEFERIYPNELDVYLETDRFVCYRIEQNMYRLYDFAIDYGYNTRDYEAEEAGA